MCEAEELRDAIASRAYRGEISVADDNGDAVWAPRVRSNPWNSMAAGGPGVTEQASTTLDTLGR